MMTEFQIFPQSGKEHTMSDQFIFKNKSGRRRRRSIFYATSSRCRWPSDRRRRRHDAIVGSNSRYFIIQRQHVTFAYTLRM